MERIEERPAALAPFWRAETGFIMFLFYSNLLTGEYTRTGRGHGKLLRTPSATSSRSTTS